MASNKNELKDILQVLDTLQNRVNTLAQDDNKDQNPTAPSTATPVVTPSVSKETRDVDPPESKESPSGAPPKKQEKPRHSFKTHNDNQELISILRAGVADLATYNKIKEFPAFFIRLASRTGLRLLLLKRWSSGLQVVLAEGIKMPPEALKRRPDGRAPIPLSKGDVFSAVGHDASIYAGPVPVKHFPLDLTLMLGRGSRNQQIIILPLPSRNHWNTFLYMDASNANTGILTMVEMLAQYALSRMCLLNKGEIFRRSQVSKILSEELFRRQQSKSVRVRSTNMVTELPSDKANDDDDDILMQPPPKSPQQDPAQQELPTVAPKQASEQADQIVKHWEQVLTNQGQTGQATTDKSGGKRVYMPDIMLPGEAEADGQPEAAAEESEQVSGKTDGPAAEAESTAPTDGDQSDENTVPAGSEQSVAGTGITPEGILHHSGELPALPRAACHIMAVIDDPRTTATKLEKAVALDQTLTAKVLRIANSPFYGAVREIRTVSEAIVRLGFVTIRNWTLVTATKSVFVTPGAGQLFQRIWRQSVLSAMASQLVAQKVGMREPENVFIGGLMQNIGQLVLARAYPELFQEVIAESATSLQPYHVVEKQMLGFDHGDLGALLLKEWNLSQDLENAVRWHHRLSDPEATGRRVAAMIALGEEIAACSGTDPEECPILWENSEPAQFLEVTAEQYQELVNQARDLSIDPHFFS